MGTNHRRRLVVVVAFVAALLAVSAVRVGATSGTLSVTTDTTLTEDHDGPIVIDADNVTLDCDGHTVTGPGRLQGLPGINMFQRTGVTVKNCVVQDFNDAFRVSQSDGNTFTNNSVSHLRQGFTLQGSDNNTLIGNSVTDASDWFGYGLLEGSDANELYGNTATAVTGVGFMSWDANNNVFTDNDASNNFGNGFGANDPDTAGNTYTGNTANNNTGTGIEDNTTGATGDAGTDNIYSDNICIRNGAGGSNPVGLCNPSGSFGDDDGSIFEFDIEWMAEQGITRGCNPPTNDMFCPDSSVTRGQMAAFLVRALGLTDDGGGDLFVDDDGSIFESGIDKLATAGITKGCNPPTNDMFCPDSNVTRGQMAAFLVRALGLTDDGGGNLFVDDDGSIFESGIDKLATAGITKGCNPPTNNRFCPNNIVTRAQMAAFLHRALGSYPAPHDTSVTPYVALEDAFVVGAGRYHRRTGDLWHSTWADDGQLYMTWGDGAARGDCCSVFPGDVVVCPDCTPVPTSVPIFDLNNPGGTGLDVCSTTSYCLCEETYFGLAVLGQSPAAAPEHCDADCIVQMDIPTGLPLPTSTRNDKPSSILSVDGTLYLAGHWPPGEATNGWIAESVDHGVTWDESLNSLWTAPSPFTVMMFIQMGQDYGLNVDGWVYALAMGKEGGWQNSAGALGEIYLARVPDEHIADYNAWEYLSAVDAAFNPSWSKDPVAGVPLAGLASSFQGAAIFHPETASYLFLVNNDPGALYQAERPWGPWKRVAELFQPGVELEGWNGSWGPLMGLIPMETTLDSVQFTNAADEHYALTIGTLRLVP